MSGLPHCANDIITYSDSYAVSMPNTEDDNTDLNAEASEPDEVFTAVEAEGGFPEGFEDREVHIEAVGVHLDEALERLPSYTALDPVTRINARVYLGATAYAAKWPDTIPLLPAVEKRLPMDELRADAYNHANRLDDPDFDLTTYMVALWHLGIARDSYELKFLAGCLWPHVGDDLFTLVLEPVVTDSNKDMVKSKNLNQTAQALSQATMLGEDTKYRWCDACKFPELGPARHIHTREEEDSHFCNACQFPNQNFHHIHSGNADSITPKEETEQAHSERCPICLESFANPDADERQVRLPCGHVVGEVCIKTWLGRHNKCVLCRSIIYEFLPRQSSTGTMYVRLPSGELRRYKRSKARVLNTA